MKKNEPLQVVQPIERLDYTQEPTPISSTDIDTESENKISNRSKRIAKVAKAKGRDTPVPSQDEFINTVDFNLIPEGFGDPAIDHKTQKKMLKMIKNRVSAQNSRDKKKVYMQQLEEMNQAYVEENSMLQQEKNLLLEKLEKLEADYALLLKENEAMKHGAINMNLQCGNGINSNLQCGPTPTINRNLQCGTAINTNLNCGAEINKNLKWGTTTVESEPDTPTTPTTEVSSPTSTINSNTGGGFSIFSVALAALLCFLFVITGGQIGAFPSEGIFFFCNFVAKYMASSQ